MSRLRTPLGLFLAAFVVSRCVFALAGLQFHAGDVPLMMHFVGLELLREHLWESVLHLQGQPPLMTLLMGAILKASGDHYPAVLNGINLVCGALIGWTMIRLLEALRFSGKAAAAAAIAFSLLPANLVYENYWFLSYPLVLLLLLLCERAVAATRDDTFLAWFGFFLVAAALVLLKNLFHPLWMVLLVALAMRGARDRPRVVAAALLPLLLVLAWPVKNAIVFGSPATSGWVGFGLARKTYHRIPLEKRRERAEQGMIDPIATVEIYGDVAAFAAVMPPLAETGVRLLDEPRKSSGEINYHHAIYVPASFRMRNEALRLILEYPGDFLDDVVRTIGVMFQPAVRWPPVSRNHRSIQTWCDAVDGVLHAEIAMPLRPWGLLALLVLILSAPAAWQALRRPRHSSVEQRMLTLGSGLILWVYTLAILFDTNETMRQRFASDGVLWVCALVVVRRVMRRFARDPTPAESAGSSVLPGSPPVASLATEVDQEPRKKPRE